ncbi:uncharacterized protein IWZ02DRAFT_460076 [Phyllosticta citriasiana]|uniref:uncharacterized protein n=1 Tax=Phyllosticta citriasiana TaxID=595635 RepID=UPI0030FD9B32
MFAQRFHPQSFICILKLLFSCAAVLYVSIYHHRSSRTSCRPLASNGDEMHVLGLNCGCASDARSGISYSGVGRREGHRVE